MNLAKELLRRVDEHRVANKRKCVVVVGDIITDAWVHGRLKECQDGCPKFVEERRCSVSGGAANAWRCLCQWDVDVHLSGHNNNRPIKYRFVDEDGKIVFRHDDETALLHVSDYEWVRREAAIDVRVCDAVLLSDYNKRILTPEFIREVVGICTERGVPCVADAKRAPELYRGSIIKANEEWRLRNLTQCDVATHGAATPCVYGVSVRKYLPPVHCVNHVGAGDCFAAYLTLALAYKFSLLQAAVIAHSAGRVYVQHPHNRAPRPEEVIADMDGQKSPTSNPAASPATDAPSPG